MTPGVPSPASLTSWPVAISLPLIELKGHGQVEQRFGIRLGSILYISPFCIGYNDDIRRLNANVFHRPLERLQSSNPQCFVEG
jgi:hypothetical protein